MGEENIDNLLKNTFLSNIEMAKEFYLVNVMKFNLIKRI